MPDNADTEAPGCICPEGLQGHLVWCSEATMDDLDFESETEVGGRCPEHGHDIVRCCDDWVQHNDGVDDVR